MTAPSKINPPVRVESPDELVRHRAALDSLLVQGLRFTTTAADPVAAEDLRGWLGRVRAVATALADHLEAPARAAVLELLAHPGLDADANALTVLRVNIAGASPNQIGDETGVTGATVRRIEDGFGCNPSTAKKLADRFGLRVLELFGQRDSEELIAATVGELREAVH